MVELEVFSADKIFLLLITITKILGSHLRDPEIKTYSLNDEPVINVN